MKKSLFLTVLTTVSLGLIGCKAVNTANTSAMSNIITDIPASAASEKAEGAVMPVNNTFSPEAAETAGWKGAYKKVLADFANSESFTDHSTWDLQDIDNDGTPELLISEAQQHVTGVIFYYYDNEKAMPILNSDRQILRYGAYGSLLICPEEGLFGIADINQGNNYTVMHKYKDHSLSFVQRTCENSGAVGKENASYKVNDDTVSEEEYDSAVNEFESKNWRNVGNQYSFDDLSALK
ncbi:MAG: hypothetical protein K5898_00025 [Ruminococcus sp.]|uniref:hypothetical protein n=1 Tax=Ruminococcus sp. TaxID=41978 RepID=UPI0025D802BE|nr:hypothetical protein [Ruminococcus sp.]MCR4793571.1 hypothetical protein [Ruminococcus sp.]